MRQIASAKTIKWEREGFVRKTAKDKEKYLRVVVAE